MRLRGDTTTRPTSPVLSLPRTSPKNDDDAKTCQNKIRRTMAAETTWACKVRNKERVKGKGSILTPN